MLTAKIMIDEQLEFLISQHADGSLPESERALVELRLGADAEARALLEEYRTLDASLKSSMPLPAVNWDRLADHLSEAVAEQRETRAATVLGRIGAWGIGASRIGTWGRIAIAACIVLAVGGVAMWTQMKPGDVQIVGNTDPTPPTGTKGAPVVIVRGPAPQPPASAPLVAVSVGPSSDVTPNWRAAEGVITGPSRAVWIASSSGDAQDSDRLPY